MVSICGYTSLYARAVQTRGEDEWGHICRAASRRDLLIASGSCALSAILPQAAGAQEAAKAAETKPATVAQPAALKPWEQSVRAVTGDAKVIEGRIVLDMPEIAENGNVIPFNASIPSAMSGDDFVRTLRIFATDNPQPLIATFRFSAESGKAAVIGRLRLAKTQDVVALAELADGTFLKKTRSIKVTIGGCGG